MKHASYDYKPRAKLTLTHNLSLGPKASSNFMTLLIVSLIL